MEKEIYYAKFYDISTILNPDFKDHGFITPIMDVNEEKIIKYIQENNINIGDIIFVGSTNQFRQEFGFYLIGENSKLITFDSPSYLPLQNDEMLVQNNIKYKELFTEMDKWYANILFFEDWLNKLETIKKYEELNLWI